MAGALRPVVLLMLFASLLFVLAGVLDGAYPGGASWFTGTSADFAALSYVFGLVNTVVALLVALVPLPSLSCEVTTTRSACVSSASATV